MSYWSTLLFNIKKERWKLFSPWSLISLVVSVVRRFWRSLMLPETSNCKFGCDLIGGDELLPVAAAYVFWGVLEMVGTVIPEKD